MKSYAAAVLTALALVLGGVLAGCGTRDQAVQAPAGTKVGPPLSASQAQALQQKYQAHKQQGQ